MQRIRASSRNRDLVISLLRANMVPLDHDCGIFYDGESDEKQMVEVKVPLIIPLHIIKTLTNGSIMNQPCIQERYTK